MINEQLKLYDNLSNDANLSDLQKYFSQIFKIRGVFCDDIEKVMILLMEEVGELAKSIRKENNILKIDYDKVGNYSDVKSEIADVFIILIAICNIYEISLSDALLKKEKSNIQRKWK